jgi:hypothetical protein
MMCGFVTHADAKGRRAQGYYPSYVDIAAVPPYPIERTLTRRHAVHRQASVHRALRLKSDEISTKAASDVGAVSASVTEPVRHFANDPRPGAWCGWYMRHLKGVADRAFNLAVEWVHWGHPVPGPRVGAVVVWRHHVGEIVGYAGAGRWLVHSGNDGHRVRTRARSVADAIAFRM